MTLEKILENITVIEGRPDLSKKNYLRSLQYISNLYNFRFYIENIIDLSTVEFLPSFKDCYICEELGIASFTEENELRLIKMRFKEPLEDKEKERILIELKKISSLIEWEADVMVCYLVNFRRRRENNEAPITFE